MTKWLLWNVPMIAIGGCVVLFTDTTMHAFCLGGMVGLGNLIGFLEGRSR